MTNRILAQYNGTSTIANHVITFSNTPVAGARIIIEVSSFNAVASTPTGYTQDTTLSAYNLLYVYSKIALGTETSVTLAMGGATNRVHAIVHERDDCQTRQFVKTGQSSSSTSVSSGAVTVPAGLTVGRVFGVLNSPGGSAAGATWNMSLVKEFSPTGSGSNSGFASGPMPAAGSRTFTVTGLTSSTDPTGIAIVGYGSTDAVAPTVPGNLHATAVTGTQIDFAWDASTDAVGVTGYGIYKGGVKQGADQTTLTSSFAGLTVGTSYTIEVDAVDAAGNRSAKASLVVSTDATPPTVPGNLRTAAITHTSITITWDASTDALTGVSGYGIYLDTFKIGADQTTLTAALAGLLPGHTYTVEVDAKDGAGNRSAKASLSVSTTADTVAPTVPGTLHTTEVTPYSFAVAWDASTDDVAVAGYGLYLDTVKQGPDLTALSRGLAPLTPATAYVVEVDAVDTSGNRSAKASLGVSTPPDVPPGTPADLHATTVTYTSIAVAWSAAADDVSVAGYDVTFDDELVATNQPGLTSTFSALMENTGHTVRVVAVDSSGQRSTVPAELDVSTLDDTPPTAPTFAVVAGEDRLTISWDASADDFTVDHYDVRLNGVTVWSTPGTDYTVDGPVVRRRTVTGLIPGALYGVWVVAVDSIGQESADTTQVVQTLLPLFLPIESPVYRIGSWAGNVRDEFGVEWVVKDEKGWSSTPPVSPVAAALGGVDGVHPGPGRYGTRVITLSGVAIAGNRAAMLAAKQRLARVLHPGQLGVLQVQDARYTRQAKVRLTGNGVEITDRGDRAFEWVLTVSASDPRRYAVAPISASAIISSLPGEASLTMVLAGNYPTIPARIRLYGPIRNFTIRHEESGTLTRAMPGFDLPSNPGYSLGLELATRQVWAYVPPEIWPAPRPGRSALAHLPAWFMLLPGENTLTVAGEPVPGQSGTPRIVVEAYDAWV